MNPTSIERLDRASLKDGPQINGYPTKVIHWRKPRAGKFIVAGPYRAGEREMVAWDMLVRMGDLIRPRAKAADRDALLLIFNPHGLGSQAPFAHRANSLSCGKWLRRLIDEDRTPMFAPLRALKGNITTDVVRTTYLHVVADRFGGETTQRIARHRHFSTTSIYLNNPGTKMRYEREIRRGQDFLLKFVTVAPDIIGHNVANIAERTGASVQEAEELLREESGSVFGLSFFGENSIIIDTPLNCLRVAATVRAIEAAEDRICSYNPQRWHRFWAVKLQVLREAYENFPRKTRAQADRLKADVVIALPEID